MEGLFEKVNECFKGKTIVFTLVYNKKILELFLGFFFIVRLNNFL